MSFQEQDFQYNLNFENKVWRLFKFLFGFSYNQHYLFLKLYSSFNIMLIEFQN